MHQKWTPSPLRSIDSLDQKMQGAQDAFDAFTAAKTIAGDKRTAENHGLA